MRCSPECFAGERSGPFSSASGAGRSFAPRCGPKGKPIPLGTALQGTVKAVVARGDEDIERVAFGLKVGEVGGPVRTPQGCWPASGRSRNWKSTRTLYVPTMPRETKP